MTNFARTPGRRCIECEHGVYRRLLRPDADAHRYVGAWSIEDCEEMAATRGRTGRKIGIK